MNTMLSVTRQSLNIGSIKMVLLGIFVLFLFQHASAQNILFSEIQKKDNKNIKFEILGKIEGHYLVYKNISRTHFLSTYDAQMQLIETNALDFLPESIFDIDFIRYPDYFIVLYQYQKNKRVFCNAAKVDIHGKLKQPISVLSYSRFDTLYQGVVLNGGGTGFRVLHNTFDIIYGEGLDFADVNLCVSGYNVFYNVGNSIGASSPTAPVVSLGNDTCVSANDLFARTDSDAYTVPRIRILTSTTVSGGTQMQMGRYARESGLTFSLANNQTNQTIFSVNNDNTKAFQMYYTISRDTSVRSGIMTVVSGPNDSTGDLDFTDDYTENSSTGVTLNVTQSGSQVIVQYTSTNTGVVGTLTYSLSHLA